MTDKSINWQPKPPSTTERSAPPSVTHSSNAVSQAFSTTTQSLAPHFPAVVGGRITPIDETPPFLQELNRDYPHCEGKLDLVLEKLYSDGRLDDAGLLIEWQIRKLISDYPDREVTVDRLLEKVYLDGRLDHAAFLLSVGAKGDPLLRPACERGDSEMVDLLLSKGVNPNLDKGAVFADVCRKGDYLCAKAFLSHGADTETEIHGNTLLGHMCLTGNKDFIELLLHFGAQVDGTGWTSRTPLYLAANSNENTKRKVAVIKDLLSRGAKIDSYNPNFDPHWHVYNTALGEACLREDVDLVRELLALGANPLADGPYSTFHYLGVDVDLPKEAKIIGELLIDATGVDYPEAREVFWDACKDGRPEIALLYLEKGMNPNFSVTWRHESLTPLMVAVDSSDTPATVVRALLERGADVEAQDSQGRKAMDYLYFKQYSKAKDGPKFSMDFEEKMKLLHNYHEMINSGPQTNSEKEI